MTTINDWPLSKKMMAAFSIIGLMMIGLGITGVIANRTLSTVADRHIGRGILGTEALGRLMSFLREHRIIVYSQLTAASEEETRTLDGRFRRNRDNLDAAIRDYQPLAGELKPQLDLIKADVGHLNDVDERIIATTRARGRDAAMPLAKGEGKESSHKAIADLEQLIREHQARAARANEDGKATAQFYLAITLVLLAISMGSLLVVWWMISRTVSSPLTDLSKVTARLAEGGVAVVPHRDRKDELGQMSNAVERFRVAAVKRAEEDAQGAEEQRLVTTALGTGLTGLAEGDLTNEIRAEFPAAYAELRKNFNEALNSLRELIGSVKDSAASIRTGSGEIAQASEDLARRTETNAASLEETSASLAQVDGRLQATAVAAARTVARADQAITTVGGGRAVAEQAVQAMGRVSDSAKGIDSVIEGLDKIAFQTRVLAMNAAVEAGRAGDAGRGFAVVADLVSALAMRAEEEAKRARDQLTVTQADIVTAVEAVQKVDGALEHISGDVGEVHELLGTMAADNQAQSSSISQISVAIGTMDRSVQQNAAMVEQTSAAARSLTREVSSLSDQAARFRVGSDAVSPARARVQTDRFAAPTKPLPPAAVVALTRPDDDWNDF